MSSGLTGSSLRKSLRKTAEHVKNRPPPPTASFVAHAPRPLPESSRKASVHDDTLINTWGGVCQRPSRGKSNELQTPVKRRGKGVNHTDYNYHNIRSKLVALVLCSNDRYNQTDKNIDDKITSLL